MNDHQSDLIKYVPPKCEKCGCEIVNLNSMCAPCAVKQAEPVQPGGAQPVGEVVDPTYVHFYGDKQYPFGTKIYTEPPAVAQIETDDYKSWYIEAMIASNEAGYVGLSAAQTIRELNKLVHEPPAAAINEQLLEALNRLQNAGLKVLGGEVGVYDLGDLGEALDFSQAVIAEAEKAKGGAA